MAFTDHPIVDRNAKVSEESTLAVKNILTQKNGFICREEYPDYGTDINVELIFSGSEATGRKFPVQIKSIQGGKGIRGDVIQYRFETSRLGYLCRIGPTYGLIIIYDEASNNCFYDFTEIIVRRLDEDKGETWRTKETVTISIPLQNKLRENVEAIYKTLSQRFDNHEILIQTNGSTFGIPTLSSHKRGSYNCSDPTTLENHGYIFLEEKWHDRLAHLLAQLPGRIILQSPILTLFEFICHSELGNAIDADYYLRKCLMNLDKYTEFDKELLQYYRVRLDFMLGRRQLREYISDLKSLTTLIKQDVNRISISINIQALEFIDLLKQWENDSEIENKLISMLDTIDQLVEDPKVRMLLKVFQSETIQQYGSFLHFEHIRIDKLRHQIGIHGFKDENNQALAKIIRLLQIPLTICEQAYLIGHNEDDKLLKAHAAYELGCLFVGQHANLFFNQSSIVNDAVDRLYKLYYNYLVEAYQIFRELDRNREVYYALFKMHEITLLYQFSFDKPLTNNTQEQYQASLNKLVDVYGYTALQSPIPEAQLYFQEFAKREKSESSLDEPEALARLLQKAYNLPEDRFKNLLNNVEDHSFFEKNNKNKQYELLENLAHNASPVTRYAQPIIYVIRNKVTGFESMPNRNVRHLMKMFDLL